MMPAWDVLGVGAVAVDDLIYLDGFPAPDTKMPVQEERREGGGLAATALVAAARLGARAAYAGVLGDDELSRFSLAELERSGVDCALVQRRPGARPIHSTVLVDRLTGQRTILHARARVVSLASEEVGDEQIAACRMLFVDSTVAALARHLARRARNLGIPVLADLEHAAATEALALVDEVDHLVIGTDFARQATGQNAPPDMLRALYRPQHVACVVTAGALGCWYAGRATGGEVCHQPACRVQVADTTGCGDVFHGAYAAALARGLGLAEVIRVATAAAGLKATRPGGRRGIPDWPTLVRFMQEQNLGYF